MFQFIITMHILKVLLEKWMRVFPKYSGLDYDSKKIKMKIKTFFIRNTWSWKSANTAKTSSILKKNPE